MCTGLACRTSETGINSLYGWKWCTLVRDFEGPSELLEGYKELILSLLIVSDSACRFRGVLIYNWMRYAAATHFSSDLHPIFLNRRTRKACTNQLLW